MRKPERAQENPKVRPAKHTHSNTSILQIKRTKKTKTTQRNCRTPGKGFLMLNTNVRQRKENKKSARMMKQYSRNQSKKNAMETAALVVLTKTLQTRKKRREKSKRQEKIILNGK